MNNFRCVITWAILIGNFVLTACGPAPELEPAGEALLEEELTGQEPDIIAMPTLATGDSAFGAVIDTTVLLDFPTEVPNPNSVWLPPP